MTKARLEIPHVAGRTVEDIALLDDPLLGRELTVRFNDGTELSVMLCSKQVAAIRHFEVKNDKTLYECDEARL